MAKMVRPALYHIPGVNVSWSWVLLKDLALITDKTPEYVWRIHFDLTKGGCTMPVAFCSWGSGTIWYVNRDGKMVQGVGTGQYALGDVEAFLQVLEDGQIYVPAGWAMRVLKVFESVIRHQEQHQGKTNPHWSAGWSRTYQHNALLLYSTYGVRYAEAREFARECGAWYENKGSKGLLVQFPGCKIEFYSWGDFAAALDKVI